MGNESWSRRVDDLITLNRSATIARLLAGVVHEVNNALQVIGGTTELLQNSPGLTEPVVKGLQRIHAQNTRAASALAEVMTFSRENADARGPVNVRNVVTRAIALRSYAVSRARLTIAQHVPAEGRLNVDGSAPLLQQALLNLIVNAEQALAGRVGGAIVVDVEQQDGWIQVRCLTTAPGSIPQSARRCSSRSSRRDPGTRPQVSASPSRVRSRSRIEVRSIVSRDRLERRL
jgi:signal transduction histidine kinase